MKMRFWQKIYIFTLILFLVCLNAGILSLAVYTYHKNVSSAEESAKAEQYYIAKAFENDYSELMEMGENVSPSLLMRSYGSHYGSKGLLFAFIESDKTVYTNADYPFPQNSNSLMHTDIQGKRHIVISADICDGRYNFIFAKNVETLDEEFRALMISYSITAFGVSAFLAVCLYFILKKLPVPLEKLRLTTEKIEKGIFRSQPRKKAATNSPFLQKVSIPCWQK